MKEQIKILILGDELGLGEPLQKALQAEGHKVDHVLRVYEAAEKFKNEKFDYAFVDCMLAGGGTGVDFIMNMRAEEHEDTKYVLMSGIFTDKGFVKESLEQTKAVKFIEKKLPFDSKAYTSLIRDLKPDTEILDNRKKLYQMFAQQNVSTRTKRKLIESLEEVSGYDLAFIFSLLVETGSSGYLNIYSKDGAVSGITIFNGEITSVDVVDKTTFLGEMLIQSGYAMPDDVTQALSERTEQKLGARLIKANQLSPHAFDLILTEQMNIRLSRMITEDNIRINFVSADVEESSPRIDSEMLQKFLHDWIASKVPAQWLKALYVAWVGNRIQFSPAYQAGDSGSAMSLVKSLPGLLEKITAGTTLNQLMMSKVYPETALLKGLHFMLTRGMIIFGDKKGFASAAEQLAFLQNLVKELDGKEAFEIAATLGLENMTGEPLIALLGLEPIAGQPAITKLWTDLKTKIENAAVNAKDSGSRLKFKQTSADRDAEAKLLTSQKIEEAKKALGLNQYAKAHELLTVVQKTLPNAEFLHLYYAWAKIGTIDPARRVQMLKEIDFELVQIPAEERYDAHYPFVLGLFAKAKGDFQGAKKQFEKAVAMNQGLLVARRELSTIGKSAQNADIFNMDLKTLVGGFFKKK